MRRIRIAPAVAAAVFLAATASAAVVGLPSWDAIPSPNPAATSQFLGVSRVASGQVWAVGSNGQRSLTARWNGSTFVAVASPSAADRATVLEDVDGIASNDVWAVGHADRIDGVGSRTFIAHWNGSAWARVASPSLGTASDINVLSGVAMIAANDVWAVGWFRGLAPASARALTLHWDGMTWRRVTNPCGPFLREVFALSSTNVWAVGGTSTCQWNGSSWIRRAAAPHTNPAVRIDLQDVTATSAGNVWAVGLGSTSCGEGVCFTGVIERWNGSSWSFRGVGEQLYGVDAVTSTDIYAVGLGRGPAILHFNGTAWEAVPTPTPPPIGRLFAVDAVSSSSLWAVGSQLDGAGHRPLALRAPSANSGAVVGSTAVGNATVSWFGPETGSTTSDQTGRYAVGGLQSGTYTFVATFEGCPPVSRSIQVPTRTTIAVPLRITC
jgi:hypothetical protein